MIHYLRDLHMFGRLEETILEVDLKSNELSDPRYYVILQVITLHISIEYFENAHFPQFLDALILKMSLLINEYLK